MLLDLPEDVLRQIGIHLFAPEILTFLSVHRRIHTTLGQSKAFWKLLLEFQNRDSNGEDDDGGSAVATSSGGTVNISVQSLRQMYMTKAHISHLPAVKWYPIQQEDYRDCASAREGHIACIMGSTPQARKIVITGGFTNDNAIYVLHAPVMTATAGNNNGKVQQQQQQQDSSWRWQRLPPTLSGNVDQFVSFVYGSSLTAINSSTAVRFGGFRSGGYSDETDQIVVLTVVEGEREGSQFTPGRCEAAEWQVVTTTNPQFGAPSRAYHTATLVAGRYLVIIGGMKSTRSILVPAILDTETWTWVEDPIALSGINIDEPSGRHGHSVILDSRRNRLVLFGGGSGDNLLRSGVDNSEVWELRMGKEWKTNLVASLPWIWHKLHANVVPSSFPDDMDESSDAGIDEDLETENQCEATTEDEVVPAAASEASSSLSRAEALCLGRCHHPVHVSPDTVLFVLGSGRPSTNGVLAYNLRTDTFMRPQVQGPLPRPRHSGVAVFLEPEGYVFVHGGYTISLGDAVGDMDILDLAPWSKQRQVFNNLAVDTGFESFRQVTDDDAAGDSYTWGTRRPSEGIFLSTLTQALVYHGGDMTEDLNSFIRRVIARRIAGVDYRSDNDRDGDSGDEDDEQQINVTRGEANNGDSDEMDSG